MTAPLRQVLLCPPSHAGWNDPVKSADWHALGFHRPPNFEAAQSAHDKLRHLLTNAGAEVLTLPATPALTLDAVYTHDATLPTNQGLILMRPGKTTRIPEATGHGNYCAQQGIPTLAEIQAQPQKHIAKAPERSAGVPPAVRAGVSPAPPQPRSATTEAGDIVWLDANTLLVGQGYRTNKQGIHQLRVILSPYQIEVIPAPLPHGEGPNSCLHLMSLMSMLDEQTILVDLPWLSVETVELLRARNFRFIEIDYSERETLACNVLALGNNGLIALEENAKTNARLRQAGFEVQTFPGKELCLNGNGGPTCLTRPLQRR